MTTWLLEIGCEELPAKVCTSLLRQLAGAGDKPGLVARLLSQHRLVAAGAAGAAGTAGAAAAPRVLISPRRVAVLVEGLSARQLALKQRFRGPRADAAFGPDGAPTAAGLGFARSRGTRPERLLRADEHGTEFVFAEVEAERRDTVEILPHVVADLIAGLEVPRGMRWGRRPPGVDEYLRFSRPIRWLVCKLGGQTVKFPFYDLVAGEITQGHRALGAPVIVDTADHYERHLREQRVVVDQRLRREAIVAGLDAAAAKLGGSWFDPGDVLAESVYLVEWPSVECGRFDERHLGLPDDVLIAAMQSHQRYFPARDADGRLLPVFLYVSNADPAMAGVVTRGNERVLEGRLDDAGFACDRDLAEGLEHMAARLGDVVFHEKLGSLADKTERLTALARWLAGGIGETGGAEGDEAGGADVDKQNVPAAVSAARFAKADLVSQVVQEFPSLQGRMGGHYATASGLPDAVARAISEQYLPLSATAPPPATLGGALLAIADKADNIAGAWVAGEKPSGSRDPYGLRRAAMGIVRITLEYSLRVPLPDLIAQALGGYVDQGKTVGMGSDLGMQGEIAAFIMERLEGLLLDEDLPFPLVEAALASRAADIPSLAARARAFAALEGRDSFIDTVAAYNRCAALAAKGGADSRRKVDPKLFAEPAEKALHEALRAAEVAVGDALGNLEIESALAAAAQLRPAVDRYFDDVLVMAEDVHVRDNRLAQLAAITRLLGQIGDFGRLPVQAS